MIRVLVVDDSAVVRQSTKFILESDPGLQVIGQAADGAEAITLAGRLKPDVITMDLRMPRVDGAGAIRAIMAEYPAPIIVVTGVDLDGESDLCAQLIKLGAVAIVRRPAGVSKADRNAFAVKLIQQVKLMSGVKVIRHPRSHTERSITPAVPFGNAGASPALDPPSSIKTQLVAVGASTGGPAALHQILGVIPSDFPLPILVVQHISFGFVEGLANWLNEASPLQVQVARHGERMQPGAVYIAPDEKHLLAGGFNRIELAATEPVGGHRPAVTALFQSVARNYGASALGVLLTGMGADGAAGLKAMREAGAQTIAQDQASCIVFGMPKEAIALGAAQQVVPLDRIARAIQETILT